ncbi:hypothetical protein KAH55_05685, partial [bacterium]|nr:hypothetical protein [bacterium]
TYYYAIVAYDRGFVERTAAGEMEGISPAECAAVIKVDEFGNFQTDINTAMVTPNPQAAGYRGAEVAGTIENAALGTGEFTPENIVFIIPDSVINGQEYEVSFRDTSFLHNSGIPFYTISRLNGDNKTEVVPETPLLTKVNDTPIFDGMVVQLNNDKTVTADFSKTGWYVGHSNWNVFVQFDPRFSSETSAAFNINAPYPADYEVRFFDTIMDTSDGGGIGSPLEQVKFQVWNVTENKPAKFLFRDVVKDQTITPDTTESIVIYVDNPNNMLKLTTTWQFVFETNPSAGAEKAPQSGDIYRLTTTKPFRTGDYIRFTVSAPGFDTARAESELDDIKVVPNPYVSGVAWETKSSFKFGRGERKIFFTHLPAECTIRIYTVRGFLVDVIEHYGPEMQLGDTTDGAASWDLVSRDNQEIAYGVYVYHIDAPGIGTKIGKFAIIK